MRHRHKWEELLPEEFYEEFGRAPIAYWVCGAMEEHGLQNALGTDLYPGYTICLRAAEKAGGIVFPPVPFAPAYFPGLTREELRSEKRELFHPSLWVSRELCERIATELMESMADMGFKVCMAFGGHAPADSMLQDVEKKHGGRIGGMKFWGGGTLRLLRDVLAEDMRKEPRIGGHGMMWETSFVMAHRPDWVDVARAERIKENPLPSQLKNGKPETIAHIAHANAAFGEKYLALGAQRLADLAKKMLADG